ncbi:hypothetical protein NECID01_1891 [Nematocida sp. AWRm77]|nr:hypothetical protein NECID01_1891 [Nematocida sp. AWRm77]
MNKQEIVDKYKTESKDQKLYSIDSGIFRDNFSNMKECIENILEETKELVVTEIDQLFQDSIKTIDMHVEKIYQDQIDGRLYTLDKSFLDKEQAIYTKIVEHFKEEARKETAKNKDSIFQQFQKPYSGMNFIADVLRAAVDLEQLRAKMDKEIKIATGTLTSYYDERKTLYTSGKAQKNLLLGAIKRSKERFDKGIKDLKEKLVEKITLVYTDTAESSLGMQSFLAFTEEMLVAEQGSEKGDKDSQVYLLKPRREVAKYYTYPAVWRYIQYMNQHGVFQNCLDERENKDRLDGMTASDSLLFFWYYLANNSKLDSAIYKLCMGINALRALDANQDLDDLEKLLEDLNTEIIEYYREYISTDENIHKAWELCKVDQNARQAIKQIPGFLDAFFSDISQNRKTFERLYALASDNSNIQDGIHDVLLSTNGFIDTILSIAPQKEEKLLTSREQGSDQRSSDLASLLDDGSVYLYGYERSVEALRKKLDSLGIKDSTFRSVQSAKDLKEGLSRFFEAEYKLKQIESTSDTRAEKTRIDIDMGIDEATAESFLNLFAETPLEVPQPQSEESTDKDAESKDKEHVRDIRILEEYDIVLEDEGRQERKLMAVMDGIEVGTIAEEYNTVLEDQERREAVQEVINNMMDSIEAKIIETPQDISIDVPEEDGTVLEDQERREAVQEVINNMMDDVESKHLLTPQDISINVSEEDGTVLEDEDMEEVVQMGMDTIEVGTIETPQDISIDVSEEDGTVLEAQDRQEVVQMGMDDVDSKNLLTPQDISINVSEEDGTVLEDEDMQEVVQMGMDDKMDGIEAEIIETPQDTSIDVPNTVYGSDNEIFYPYIQEPRDTSENEKLTNDKSAKNSTDSPMNNSDSKRNLLIEWVNHIKLILAAISKTLSMGLVAISTYFLAGFILLNNSRFINIWNIHLEQSVLEYYKLNRHLYSPRLILLVSIISWNLASFIGSKYSKITTEKIVRTQVTWLLSMIVLIGGCCVITPHNVVSQEYWPCKEIRIEIYSIVINVFKIPMYCSLISLVLFPLASGIVNCVNQLHNNQILTEKKARTAVIQKLLLLAAVIFISIVCVYGGSLIAQGIVDAKRKGNHVQVCRNYPIMCMGISQV